MTDRLDPPRPDSGRSGNNPPPALDPQRWLPRDRTLKSAAANAASQDDQTKTQPVRPSGAQRSSKPSRPEAPRPRQVSLPLWCVVAAVLLVVGLALSLLLATI